MTTNYFSATLPNMPSWFRPHKGAETEAQAAAVHAVEQAVCAFYGLSLADLNSACRRDDMVMARHIVRYLLWQEGLGIKPMARVMGSDPANTRKSVKLVKGYVETGGKVTREIWAIRSLLIN